MDKHINYEGVQIFPISLSLSLSVIIIRKLIECETTLEKKIVVLDKATLINVEISIDTNYLFLFY